MIKKLTILGIAFIILFSLTGCVDLSDGLTAYKIDAKAAIQAYADGKGEEKYTAENWKEIENAVTAGKDAVQVASDRMGVDTAVETAKENIDEVKPKESDIMQNGAYFITDVSWENYVRNIAKDYGESESWIQDVLNGGDGGNLNHLVKPRNFHWVAAFDELLTLSKDYRIVYQFSYDDGTYTGYSLNSTIKFWLVDDVLFIRSGSNITQYKRDNSYQISEDTPVHFSAPINIDYGSGGLGLNYVFFTWNPSSGYGWFGAGVEVKKADSEDFVLTKLEFAYMYTFVAQLGDTAFAQGVNTVRINYIGGPSLIRNSKNVYKIQSSEYAYFNVIVDAEGNVTIEEVNR